VRHGEDTLADLEIASAIVIPLLAFILNWVLRSRKDYALSGAADFALGLAAFDLTAIVAYKAIEPVVRNPTFHDGFISIFVILFCIVLTLWLIFFLPWENRMLNLYDQARTGYADGRPTGRYVVAWTVLAMCVAPHIFAFAYE
jgi:hypothetical protein